MMDGMYRAGLA